MDWIEITVSTNSEGADIVSEALMRQGAVGTQIVDRADDNITVPVSEISKSNLSFEFGV